MDPSTISDEMWLRQAADKCLRVEGIALFQYHHTVAVYTSLGAEPRIIPES